MTDHNNQMIDPDGKVYLPSDIGQAYEFARDHGAQPVDPERFTLLSPRQKDLVHLLPYSPQTAELHDIDAQYWDELASRPSSKNYDRHIADGFRRMARINRMSPDQMSEALLCLAARHYDVFDKVVTQYTGYLTGVEE